MHICSEFHLNGQVLYVHSTFEGSFTRFVFSLLYERICGCVFVFLSIFLQFAFPLVNVGAYCQTVCFILPYFELCVIYILLQLHLDIFCCFCKFLLFVVFVVVAVRFMYAYTFVSSWQAVSQLVDVPGSIIWLQTQAFMHSSSSIQPPIQPFTRSFI